MRFAVRFGFVLAVILTACELAVSTSGLDNGPPRTPDSGSADSPSIFEASTAVDGTTPATDGATPDAGFCDSLGAPSNLVFCEDWDQANRSTPFTNGWLLANAGPVQSIVFSGPGEPVVSAPHSLKLVESIDAGSARTSMGRIVDYHPHAELHFKIYPTPVADPGTPFMGLGSADGTCSFVLRYNDINTYCPDYADLIPFPQLPTNTWSEIDVTIDDVDGGSTVSISGPFGVLEGTGPSVPYQVFGLGQAVDDFDQTAYFDNLYMTGN